MMTPRAAGRAEVPGLDPRTEEFYRRAMRTLTQERIPFLVGGAYAFARYTGIVRHTKDFDVFILPADVDRALRALDAQGCHTELWSEVWLAKAFAGDDPETFVDLIFSSGNGLTTVDHDWFAHAVPETVLGMPVRLIPAEEMIWSKAFVQERERYDGADVAHTLRARGAAIDWPRLIARFGEHWRVLYSYLVLFGFTYPHDRDVIPPAVLRELSARLLMSEAATPPAQKVCYGTLLSNQQYLPDVECWGYHDGRIVGGSMSAAEVRRLTDELKRNNPTLTARE
ncbi:MAG: hypothetical protein ACHQ4H_05905 [Ktedonobacterales bacterium]